VAQLKTGRVNLAKILAGLIKHKQTIQISTSDD